MAKNSSSPPNAPQRLPLWLKSKIPGGKNYVRLKSLARGLSLHTVCESASCPNIGSCWQAGTLTLMILGDSCSRACGFCDVPTGGLRPPDKKEPANVAEALAQLDLNYVVITSVDRDDLPDYGAAHWAETIRRVKAKCPELKLEVLTPDFRGDPQCLETVCLAGPDVLAHNVETTPSLQAKVRPQSRYQWSLDALSYASRNFGLVTKSGLMLGMGETREEVIQTMRDLLQAGCRILSIGQYLRPTRNHLPVAEFVHPDQFAEYKTIGEALGFDHVESGPLVRSSYRADLQALEAGILR